MREERVLGTRLGIFISPPSTTKPTVEHDLFLKRHFWLHQTSEFGSVKDQVKHMIPLGQWFLTLLEKHCIPLNI